MSFATKDIEQEVIEHKSIITRTERLNRIKNGKSRKFKNFILSFFVLLVMALTVIYIINLNGNYPWGSDSFGHLYKGSILYDAFKEGDFFLNYDPNWYNGVQPFRYWAPMPYYILAIINLFTNNIFISFNIFIIFIFMLGGTGFLLWGYYTNRQTLGLVLGILWFFIPHNLKVLFSEGNLPYAIVNALIPLVYLAYYKSLVENKLFNYICLALLLGIVTLNHAMLAAMMGVSLFIFAVIHSIYNKSFIKNFLCLCIAFLGILLVSFWLIPALQGGLMSIDKEAVTEVMIQQSYKLSYSLNPFLRLENREVYYFGLSIAIVALFGILFSYKKEKIGFIGCFIILIGTTTVALPLLKELPLNQVFWMNRFTSIAAAMVFISILFWKNLRKILLFLLIIIILGDSLISFNRVGFNREYPNDISNVIDKAEEVSSQRIGMLDTSSYASFPSYYISYSGGNVRKQVYGWAWQGATTAENIVNINYGLEKGYYGVVFDRTLELGADTVVIRKSIIENEEMLRYWAEKVGYNLFYEDERDMVYKYPVQGEFGTKVQYEGLAIGKYGSNIIYNFPNFTTGKSDYIDEYTYEELSNYKCLFLSGFKYRDKKKAEELITKLYENGTRVVIDSSGIDDKGILGIVPQSISLKGNYGELYKNGEKKEVLDFPKELEDFRCNFFTNVGVDESEDYVVVGNMIIPYKNVVDENLVLLGLNLPYYATETKDETAINILSEALGVESNVLPQREVVDVSVNYIGDKEIIIESNSNNVLTSLSAIDAFIVKEGEFANVNNLVQMDGERLVLEIGYPNFKLGIMLSVMAGMLLLVICMVSKNKRVTRFIEFKMEE